MSAQWRADGAPGPGAVAGEAASGVREVSRETSAPVAADATVPNGDATVPTGDDAIDVDVAALTAATHGPLDGVLETAERLHVTLQHRLAEGGDA